MLIINCNFLINKTFYYVIYRIAQFICVCEIENVIISFLEYIFLKNFLLEKRSKEKIIIGKIRCYVYVVDNFKINFFIKLNILGSKQIIINYRKKTLYINNYREM
jgi:hypothetical protein